RFMVDGEEITKDFQVGAALKYDVDEVYPWRGVHSLATNHCHGATISFEHPKSHTKFTIEVRAYNDGVAFRYIIPGNQNDRVPDEAVTFRVPAGSTVWYHGLEGHYEGVHVKKPIAEIAAG